jgi:hypothetical protein
MRERCQCTAVLVYLIITLSLLIHFSFRRDIAMAETPSAAPPPFPIHAPIFISRVYPVLEVDHTLVEWVDPIEDAYSFWGKTLLSAVFPEETTFFPAPLSYPYRFSQQGIQNLQQKLKQIQEIDSATITERDFPNILPNRQELYSAEEKKKFLRGEKYISFRINGWPSVEVMKFPTFVVLAFDHTSTSVKALEDYRQLVAKDWNDKIETFHKFDNLRRILGITHKEAVWRRDPSLTFIAFLKPDVYYYNHYLWRWETQPEHVKIPFLKDIRLQGLKGSTYPDYLVLKQCKNIVYEYASDRPFGRFYYASHPLFYQGKNFPGRDSSFLHGSEGLVERILRTALFVNVTLPSMVDLSQKLKDSLGRNVYEI